MKEFLYALNEEYLALGVADPNTAPEQIDFSFYWESFHSPLLAINDFVDRDVWALGEFLPVEEAFPGMSLVQRIDHWELQSGEKWDETKVFRAWKIRLEVFFSQEYEADIEAAEIGESLAVDYWFGTSDHGLVDYELDWSISCHAGSIQELESCMERKRHALSRRQR